MGFKCHKHGVKAELRARFGQAFKEFASLADARDAATATRSETVAVIDGNVVAMSTQAPTLDAYMAFLTASLKHALATCSVTIVAFDEPEEMTLAKLQEQMKRDASRTSTQIVCSADMSQKLPTDDDYTRQWLQAAENVRPLVQNRAIRHRFLDEVARLVLLNLKSQIERWNDAGYEGGHVVFDGVDPRGADRPANAPRVAGMVGTCSRIVSLFAREQAIGEGDLKLAQLGRRARSLCEANEKGFENTKLSLCTTIDTDSFAIELIEEAKRANPDQSKPFNTLLCMRERARKRGAEDDKQAVYLCCDITLLHTLLQRHIWGISRAPTQPDRRAAVTLLAAGWALAGCDFVELKGMRSDYVLDALPVVAKTVPGAIQAAKFAWTGVRDDVFKLESPIRALAMACADRLAATPRARQDALLGVRDPDPAVLRRAAWATSYWNSHEFKGDMQEFGFVQPFSAD